MKCDSKLYESDYGYLKYSGGLILSCSISISVLMFFLGWKLNYQISFFVIGSLSICLGLFLFIPTLVRKSIEIYSDRIVIFPTDHSIKPIHLYFGEITSLEVVKILSYRIIVIKNTKTKPIEVSEIALKKVGSFDELFEILITKKREATSLSR